MTPHFGSAAHTHMPPLTTLRHLSKSSRHILARAGIPRDYDAQEHKLLAELSYRSRFTSSTTSQSEPEAGVVAGAKVTWADDATLKLHRRAIIHWDEDTPIKNILIVKKPGDLAAAAKLKELAEWLERSDIKVYVERNVHLTEAPMFQAFHPLAATIRQRADSDDDQETDDRKTTEHTANGTSSSSSSSQQQQIDLCITLGGDGTVLHLASLFGADEQPVPPVISFAMGTLGFLTPFNAAMARTVLSRLLWPPWQGESIFCTLRARKRCEIYAADGQLQRVHTVLNECLVDRGATPSMVVLEVFIDGTHLTTVQSDGLIISTPSGSTAYSMAAGGPMVAPSVPGTILTPVAPHSLSFRPIVVPESSVIEVHLPQSSRTQARASFDGRHATRMQKDWSIVCKTAKFALPSVNMHALDEDWYEGITAKLSWTGSLRSQRSFYSPRDR